MNDTNKLSLYQQDLLRALAVVLPVLLVFGELDWAYLLYSAPVWLPLLISAPFRPKPFFLTGVSLAAAIPFGFAIVFSLWHYKTLLGWNFLTHFALLPGWIAGWLTAAFLQRADKVPPFWAGLAVPLASMGLFYVIIR